MTLKVRDNLPRSLNVQRGDQERQQQQQRGQEQRERQQRDDQAQRDAQDEGQAAEIVAEDVQVAEASDHVGDVADSSTDHQTSETDRDRDEFDEMDSEVRRAQDRADNAVDEISALGGDRKLSPRYQRFAEHIRTQPARQTGQRRSAQTPLKSSTATRIPGVKIVR